MKVPAPVRRAVALSLAVAGALAFLAPLLTRVTLGHAFFLTGRGKLAHFETTVAFFATQGIPMPELNAALVSRLEYYGGALLVAGLLTRVVSLLLAGTMAVALLQERQQFLTSWLPTGEVGPTDIAPWVFLVLLLWLVLHGPGAASVDRLLARHLAEEESPPVAVEPARAA